MLPSEEEFLVVPRLRCAIGGNTARPIIYIICQFITHSKSLKAKLSDKKTETIKSSNNLILLFAAHSHLKLFMCFNMEVI